MKYLGAVILGAILVGLLVLVTVVFADEPRKRGAGGFGIADCRPSYDGKTGRPLLCCAIVREQEI